MKQRLSLPSLALTLALGGALTVLPACGRRHHIESKPVSLAITIVDSQDNVWVDMPVRIVEAWNEWSDDYRRGRDPWATLDTDDRGEVFFSSEDIVDAELGFLESSDGRALLAHEHWRNQAEFTVEVGTDQLGYIEVTIPVHFRETHLDVLIEFEPEAASLSRASLSREDQLDGVGAGKARRPWRNRL